MLRSKEICDDVEYLIEALFEAYHDSSCKDGSVSLNGKHLLAELTLENWWRLQGKLILWAQAHMTGYSILMNCPELVDFLEDKLGYEISEDSFVLEWIGLQYVSNIEEFEQEELIDELLSEFEKTHKDDVFSDVAMRYFLNELFMSRCAKTSYWRFPLQEGLIALNDGEVLPLVKAEINKKQGRPFSLLKCKLHALQQVWYLVGKGMKKYRALDFVADGIGQSSETLRVWERSLKPSPDFSFRLFSSKLAGEYFEELKDGHYTDIPDYELYGMSRGVYSFEMAKYLLPELIEGDLDKIRVSISKFRN